MNTTVTPEIAAFAAAVRAQLRDLPVDEVDDIVDGLESDLAEQAAERGDDFTIPDAAAYAAELRVAAGLPERPAPARLRRPLGERVTEWRERTGRSIRSTRAGAWLLDFAVALRPVWWLARGWALYVLVVLILGLTLWRDLLESLPIPRSGFAGILVAATAVVSVQWGRGRWMPRRWLRAGVVVLSVVSVVMLPFLVGFTFAQIQSWRDSGSYGGGYEPSQPGLVVDGGRVRNVFAYDKDGNPLTDVQLFDQDGRPLTTVGSEYAHDDTDGYFFGGGGPVPVAVTVPGRAPIWNVFPLAEIPAGAQPDENGRYSPDLAQPAAPPFAQVPSVERLTAPATTATPGPEASATPGPEASATPHASSGASPHPSPTGPAPTPTVGADG
ncbi:hypothetical protein [Microbacterium luticocti]|uniref:hypothetical protein n=1 Tax=Microbacterium luticocti TaxID=451764 RepID=UPI0004152E31|nr:hypothetical protein [Microbacterium luticocti]